MYDDGNNRIANGFSNLALDNIKQRTPSTAENKSRANSVESFGSNGAINNSNHNINDSFSKPSSIPVP